MAIHIVITDKDLGSTLKTEGKKVNVDLSSTESVLKPSGSGNNNQFLFEQTSVVGVDKKLVTDIYTADIGKNNLVLDYSSPVLTYYSEYLSLFSGDKKTVSIEENGELVDVDPSTAPKVVVINDTLTAMISPVDGESTSFIFSPMFEGLYNAHGTDISEDRSHQFKLVTASSLSSYSIADDIAKNLPTLSQTNINFRQLPNTDLVYVVIGSLPVVSVETTQLPDGNWGLTSVTYELSNGQHLVINNMMGRTIGELTNNGGISKEQPKWILSVRPYQDSGFGYSYIYAPGWSELELSSKVNGSLEKPTQPLFTDDTYNSDYVYKVYAGDALQYGSTLVSDLPGLDNVYIMSEFLEGRTVPSEVWDKLQAIGVNASALELEEPYTSVAVADSI